MILLAEKILRRLLVENDFQINLAKACKVSQYAIKQRAVRDSQLLLILPCVKVYKEYGYKEEEIEEDREPIVQESIKRKKNERTI